MLADGQCGLSLAGEFTRAGDKMHEALRVGKQVHSMTAATLGTTSTAPPLTPAAPPAATVAPVQTRRLARGAAMPALVLGLTACTAFYLLLLMAVVLALR